MTLAQHITNALRGRWCGSFGLGRCPLHDDQTPSLKIVDDERKLDGLDLHCFAGCDWRQVKAALRQRGLLGADFFGGDSTKGIGPQLAYTARQRQKARRLWAYRKPIEGSPAEQYLRVARAYRGSFPATLGFLPASSRSDRPALIAAFALVHEPHPAMLSIPTDGILGIHLTLLKSDGSGKAGTEHDKIMVGPSKGFPIVVAPLNDMLGLVICEGIETGLSLYEATGCGVWAAGSAGRMPALADKVPSYVDCITIAGEGDRAGRRGARALAAGLQACRLHHELRFLGDAEARAA